MLLIFDRIIKKDAIQAYEKTWCRSARFNDHDFQQTLWRWIEESLKNETRMWSRKKNKREHTQKIKSAKKNL